jgi:hypothetical protein
MQSLAIELGVEARLNVVLLEGLDSLHHCVP